MIVLGYTVDTVASSGRASKHEQFLLNMCKPINNVASKCDSKSAVCLRAANNDFLSYGSYDSSKIYFEDGNFHVRYTNGSKCDDRFDNRRRSSDIELICDHHVLAHNSRPSLYDYNDCLAKFSWRSPVVCSLIQPTCSVADPTENSFYSLRQLTSRSHFWQVTSDSPKFKDKKFILNVCKPLEGNHTCGASSAACLCNNELNDCKSIGTVTDHEISIVKNESSYALVLTYEDDERTCEIGMLTSRTQIKFICSNLVTGHQGPKFVGDTLCTYYFEWVTRFACPRQILSAFDHGFQLDVLPNGTLKWDGTKLGQNEQHLSWNLSSLMRQQHVVDDERHKDAYTYVIDLNPDSLAAGSVYDKCYGAAICQTQANGFKRNVGSASSKIFLLRDPELHLVLHSPSKCGRNLAKNATSFIIFNCANPDSTDPGAPRFLFESEDCEYFFVWDTPAVCSPNDGIPLMEIVVDQPIEKRNSSNRARSSSFGIFWFLVLMFLGVAFGLVGWVFTSNSPQR